MKRNEEAERLEKQKERWNKERSLSKEEEVLSWTHIIEALEKVYKHFYSYKDFPKGKFNPKPVWLCKGNYTDEDNATCKEEVMRILNLCKKEYILINSPAIASLIYVNRLNEREAGKGIKRVYVGIKEVVSSERQRKESLSGLPAYDLQTEQQSKLQSDEAGNAKYINAVNLMFRRRQ
jgi:hypothetical protein